MKLFYALLILTITSCSTIQYKSTTHRVLPELGTIGIFSNYLLEKNYQPKTVVSIDNPIRLHIEEIALQKREIFKKKDSLHRPKKDKIITSLKVLDHISLIRQINGNKELLKYLKKAEGYTMVTQIAIHFPEAVLMILKKADEVYLIQNKQKTLSLELRKNNEVFDQIEFTEGTIEGFKTSAFCWGQSKRRTIEIFDMIPKGTTCGGDTFKSAKKTEKKHEFKF